MQSFCDTHLRKDREMAKTSDRPGTFFRLEQDVRIFGLWARYLSQPLNSAVVAAKQPDIKEMKGCGCVPVKPDLQRHVGDQI